MPRILAEKVGNRIHVKPGEFLGGELFAQYLAASKRIAGVSYSKVHRCQTAPLDIEVCRQLREIFKSSLVIGPELDAWGRTAVVQEKALLGMMDFDMTKPLPLPRVERIAPFMHAALLARGYQTIVPHFANVAGNYLNADQPGLGKTIETFASIVESGIEGHILVIAPKTSLEATWRAEVDKWMADCGGVAYVADGPPAARSAIIESALADDAPYVFLMVNPEMVRLKEAHHCPLPGCDSRDFCREPKNHKVTRESKFPLLFDVAWDAIIGDEVHRVLMHANPRSKNKSQVGLGFQRLHTDDPKRGKIALSGTPMRGKPRLLWPTFHWLRPDLYTGQWRWSKQYFKTVPDSYAYDGEKITDDLREDREDAFNRELGKMMIRRTKPELRKLNPDWAPADKRYAEVWLPLAPAQARSYKAMEKGASVMLQGGTLNANGILAEMTRLRQFANANGRIEGTRFVPQEPSNKIDWLLDSFLSDRGIFGDKDPLENGDTKVVIASQFTQFINLIAIALDRKGIQHEVLTGETNKGTYFAEVQKRWQKKGGARVLLMNTMAGGVSITLDYADDLVILDETWVPDDQEQVEDRIHRTSRTDHQVTIYYVRSEGTIERDLAGENAMKDDRQKRSLDGRRGVEVARRKWSI